MLSKAVGIWIVGLFTIVPYATYHLLFDATRDQYAFLIVGVLFWIFGYWGVVGPLLAAIKVRRVFRTIEQARSRDELLAHLRSPEARAVAIDLIATENHIPRFLASRVVDLLASRLSSMAGASGPPSAGSDPPAAN